VVNERVCGAGFKDMDALIPRILADGNMCRRGGKLGTCAKSQQPRGEELGDLAESFVFSQRFVV
jgi:hypothetical protein